MKLGRFLHVCLLVCSPLSVTAAQAPVADFSASPTVGVHPLIVNFTDLTSGTATTWFWTFGDGGGSTARHPSHLYTAAGTYTISLTASGPGGSDSETKVDYIVVNEQPPLADFFGAPTLGTFPHTVHFTDLTTGVVTAWAWTFGDGGMSTAQNPAHTYTSAGTYTVAMTASGPGGSDTRTLVDYVTVSAPPVSADFAATPTSGGAPLNVSFSDLSSGDVTSWMWNFGDGGSSSQQNPTHTYAAVGTYTVSLTAIGPSGNDVETKADYVQVYPDARAVYRNGDEVNPACFVAQPPVLGATWTSTVDSSAVPGTTFTIVFGRTAGIPGVHTMQGEVLINPSSGVLFDSFRPASGGLDVHSFPVPLNYNIIGQTGYAQSFLFGPNAQWGNAADITLGVAPASTPPTAAFTPSVLQGSEPLTVAFNDASTGSLSSWTWSFGDGNSSSTQNPAHTYTSAGTYSVSLCVEGPGGYSILHSTDLIVVDPVVVADFSGTPTAGDVPLTVAFTDLSSGGATSWSWDFGDTGTSNLQNPTHTYNAVGTYTVSLTATGATGNDAQVKTDYVVVTPVAPMADFSGTPLGGFLPLTVNFTDLSSGAVSTWAWSFGDGGSDSVQNPSYTYTAAGTYSVSLTVTGPGGTDTELKSDYVVAAAVPPTADFTGTPLTGQAPLVVSFTDLSTGDVTAWAWTFGDGSGSTNQSPGHLYASAGTYTVSLQATGPAGSDTETKTGYVVVTDATPAAEFSATPLNGVAPVSVSFTDLSAGDVTMWSWDFGDTNSSTAQNPVHTYASPGTYSVSLTATGPLGVDTLTKTDYITALPPPPVADFAGAPTVGDAPLDVAFTDATSGVVTSWSWSFGDGAGSSQQNPNHLYTSTGTFAVALTASGPGGSHTETKVDYIFVGAPSFEDGSFEQQVAGTAPAAPWSVIAGVSHVILPNGGVASDDDMPSEGSRWADLSALGSNAATPPSNPGGQGTAPVGAAGIAQSFGLDPANPVLMFDAAFILSGAAASSGTNDFMSIDVTDGSSSHNLFYQDTFSGFPNTSTQHGLPMTAVERVFVNLDLLFPSATPTTLLTLSIQVGNGGDALNSSRGYVDNFYFGPSGIVHFRNGIGVNPEVYVAPPPLLGQEWAATIDTSGFPTIGFTFIMAHPAPLAGVPTMSGELLVHTGTPQVFSTFAVAGQPLLISVPPVINFLGNTAYTQGVLFNGGTGMSTFTNAADMTMGLALAAPAPGAVFMASPTGGAAPLTVSFTDQSTGAVTSYDWSFGDGNSSTDPNPTHTYTSSGTYSVTLRTTGPGGYDLENAYGLIVVP